MYQNEVDQISKVIKNYFEGIFYGDVTKVQNTFCSNAHLYGDIKGKEYIKNLDDYIDGLQNRDNPHDRGESFNMEILSIEIIGRVAIAKLHVPMLGYNYYDFLSFSLINNQWKIVNKLFVHVD